MFRFFFDASFDQGEIITNYNLIADAFEKQGIPLKKLDPEGVCEGLTVNYLLFAHEQRRSEYYLYVNFIASLTPEKILLLAKKYSSAGKKELKIGDIRLNHLVNFLKVVSAAQDQQSVKIIGANWDRTALIFCDKRHLAQELEKAGIANGALMQVSMGQHTFAIEKTAEGFYLFEPNNILKEPALLKTTQQVAKAIIKNIDHYGGFSNSNVAFGILFLSYAHKNRELDDLIDTFAIKITSSSLSTTIADYLAQYHQGKLSRAELALVMHDLTAKSDEPAIADFHGALSEYLDKNGITRAQQIMAESIKANKNFTNGTAFTFVTSTIHLAVSLNLLTELKTILASGGNVNQLTDGWHTPLHFAAQEGHIEAAKILLEYEPNVNQATRKGTTPLGIATLAERPEMMELLLSAGANPEHRDRDGETALLVAAHRDYTEGVAILLKAGANPDQRRRDGMTALLIAARMGNKDIVKTLLQYQADPNLAADNVTPLFIAAQHGHTEVVNLLLATPTIQVNDAMEASAEVLLQHAKETRCLKEVKHLFAENQIYRHIADFTPLHAAVFFGHTEIVAMLLDHGADFNAKAEGVSALDIARALKQKDISALLEAKQELELSPRKTK